MVALETDLGRLSRYVPRVATEWGLDAPDARWQALDATLCFVDISGFTSLSERLARRGRIGAEELTDVLNRVFGRMLDLAYERAGELLKFGGDALLLQFVGADHPLQGASAAVEMRAALREAAQIPTSIGRVPLRMSIGLHSGMVHLFRVGTSHSELIVTGPAASRVTQMEGAADAGEILVSPEMADRLPSGALAGQKGPGQLLRWRKAAVVGRGARVRRPVGPTAVAESVPAGLRHHLAHGSGETEHRFATVGFVKFQGVDALMSTQGPDAVADALHEVVSTVQNAADLEGITFLATDIDKDGGKVILVGGVPKTQEDDDGRLLRTLRSIAASGTRLPLKIGVNRGHVFAGEVGVERRATFTVMGDTVNLAARLMAAAPPGELYATPDVLDRSRTQFATVALEPFLVRGKADPVQAYSVGREIGNRAIGVRNELLFVGRAPQLALLADAIADVHTGRGGVVTILGGTGVGKSRLVEEAKRRVGDLSSLSVHGEPNGATHPYRAFRDPIRELLGVARADQATMAAQLRASVEARNPALLPLLPLLGDVTHIELPRTVEVDAIELRFRPDRSAEVLVGALEASSPGPMVFIVEDAQWMDTASVGLLERLTAVVVDRPWLFIVARRPGEGGFEPASGVRIELDPLSLIDAKAIVVDAMAAAPLRPHEIDIIVQRSGGSPLFLDEMLRLARSTGRVESLPDSLDAVINAELDALASLPRLLLRYASVLGRSFRPIVLQGVLADERIELDDATTRQLGRFLEYEGTDRVRFRHAMHRDVAYEGLSYRRRRELHLRAGEVTERLAGDGAESVADLLSLHYAMGQDHARAWRYARIAGDRARERYANVEAAAQYERAIESARRLPDVPTVDTVGVWTMLGDVREQLGVFDAALEAYRRASRLVGNDQVASADLLWRRARARMHVGAYRTALSEATKGRRLLAPLQQSDAATVRARLTALQALLRQAQQRAAPARRLAQRAIEEATEAGDDVALARAYLIRDWANRVLGDNDDAMYAEQALAIYERLGDLDGVGKASNNLGGSAYFNGDWGEAVAWYSKALDAYHRCGNDASAAVAGSNLAEVLVSRRAFADAEPMLIETIQVLRAAHALDDVLFAEIQLGRLLVERREAATAIEHLTAVRQEALTVGQVGYAFEAAMYVASALVSLGRRTDAVELIDRAEADLGFVDPIYKPSLARVRALAEAGPGRVVDGRRLIADGLTSARSQGLAYEEALLLLASLELDLLDGDEPDAAVIRDLQVLSARFGVDLASELGSPTGTSDRRDQTPAMS